jgi:formylmethanofuran dehydrogenase subunit C
VTAGRSNAEIRALPAFLGKRQHRVGDFFDVDGETGDELRIVGDASRVKWIGRGMTRGRIMVDGNAGMHLGAYMEGGTIEVSGNAGDWPGAEMRGGHIRIGGGAGGQVGGAYRGSLTGMRNGTIFIGGTAGLEVGIRMLRGTIVVAGGVRDFAGLEMKGGTIILGGAELRTGASMMRGTIVSLKPIPILPTFLYASAYNPTFLALYRKMLDLPGFDLPDPSQGVYRRYSGDQSIPGKGELLVWEPRS